MTCIKCKQEIQEDSKFCANCGTIIQNTKKKFKMTLGKFFFILLGFTIIVCIAFYIVFKNVPDAVDRSNPFNKDPSTWTEQDKQNVNNYIDWESKN